MILDKPIEKKINRKLVDYSTSVMRLPRQNHENRIISGKPFDIIACKSQNYHREQRNVNCVWSDKGRVWTVHDSKGKSKVSQLFLLLHCETHTFADTPQHNSMYRKILTQFWRSQQRATTTNDNIYNHTHFTEEMKRKIVSNSIYTLCCLFSV